MTDEPLPPELQAMEKEFTKFERWYEWVKEKSKWTSEDYRKFLFGGVTFSLIIFLGWHFFNYLILLTALGVFGP